MGLRKYAYIIAFALAYALGVRWLGRLWWVCLSYQRSYAEDANIPWWERTKRCIYIMIGVGISLYMGKIPLRSSLWATRSAMRK